MLCEKVVFLYYFFKTFIRVYNVGQIHDIIKRNMIERLTN